MLGQSWDNQVEAATVLRALGITLVAANHVDLTPPTVAGGLNLLMLTSGYTMARFAFTADTKTTLRSFRAVAVNLTVPALGLTLLTALLKRTFNVWEVLLVNNWVNIPRVARFPMWYVQALVQILLALAILFFVFDLTPKIRARPRLVTGLLLMASLPLTLWDGPQLGENTTILSRLPFDYLWNLVLGWFVWAVLETAPAAKTRLALFGAVVLSAAPVYLLIDTHRTSWARLLLVCFAGALLIWRPKLNVSAGTRHVILLVNYATLWIFLLHQYLLGVVVGFTNSLGLERTKFLAAINLVIGVVVPVLLWALWTAVQRTRSQTIDLHASPRESSLTRATNLLLPSR